MTRILFMCLSAVLAAGTSAGCAAVTSGKGPVPFPGAPDVRAANRGPAAATLSQAVVATALQFRGTRYAAGGADPRTGFDCSGFVRYVLAQHAIEVPRTAADQHRAGRSVKRDLQPGDLVFFSTIAPGPSHVGIVVSTSGEFVHAPADGGVVRVERWDTDYWRRRWFGARRVIVDPMP